MPPFMGGLPAISDRLTSLFFIMCTAAAAGVAQYPCLQPNLFFCSLYVYDVCMVSTASVSHQLWHKLPAPFDQVALFQNCVLLEPLSRHCIK